MDSNVLVDLTIWILESTMCRKGYYQNVQSRHVSLDDLFKI